MRHCFFLLILFLFTINVEGHTINYALADAANTTVGWYYMQLGFTHILPYGLDHILFVVGLFLLQPDALSVINQATVFTVAHCLTLALTMLGYIQPPRQAVEVVIALSILFIAIENICLNKIYWWRYLIVFLFGLIHGCGFATVLHQTGLPPQATVWALFAFNVGVEVGQIAVIAICYMLIGKLLSNKNWYRQKIVVPISVIIGIVSVYWIIERI